MVAIANVRKIAHGSVFSGAFTSSAMLTSPSKPMNAKNASSVAAKTPDQAAPSPDADHTALTSRKSPRRSQAPINTIVISPTTSISVIMPAIVALVDMPAIAMPPIEASTVKTSSSIGKLMSRAR